VLKKVNICQTGFPKLNFEKKHFPVSDKKFRKPRMKLKIFLGQFPNPWWQGWVVMPKNVKKPKSLHPNVHDGLQNLI
jgi:hypothetical protein